MQITLVNQAEIIQRIYEFTSGHPNVVQLLCHRLIVRLNKKQTHRITPDDVKEVGHDASFLKNDFLLVYWQRSTVLERLASLVMIADENARTHLTVYEALGRRGIKVAGVDDVYHALERLVDLRNILRRNRDSAGYDFAVTAFPLVIHQTDRLDNYISRYRDIYLKSGDIVPRRNV